MVPLSVAPVSVPLNTRSSLLLSSSLGETNAIVFPSISIFGSGLLPQRPVNSAANFPLFSLISIHEGSSSSGDFNVRSQRPRKTLGDAVCAASALAHGRTPQAKGAAAEPLREETFPISRSLLLCAQANDLMDCEESSQYTGDLRKYDSLARWQASAAWWPKTASCTTGWRLRTASKKFPNMRTQIIVIVAVPSSRGRIRFFSRFGIALLVPFLAVRFAHLSGIGAVVIARGKSMPAWGECVTENSRNWISPFDP